MKETKYTGKVVGGVIPPLLSNYILLFGLKFRLSTSEVLRMALKEWFKSICRKHSKENLLKDILLRYQEEWDTIRMKDMCLNSAASFQKFKNDLEVELTKRGLYMEDISYIIDKIKFETA